MFQTGDRPLVQAPAEVRQRVKNIGPDAGWRKGPFLAQAQQAGALAYAEIQHIVFRAAHRAQKHRVHLCALAIVSLCGGDRLGIGPRPTDRARSNARPG